MNELTIQIDNTPGLRTFKLTGPLTLGTLFEFQNLARAECDSAAAIDLSGVPYMDSAGLGAVLGVLASCERKGRGFALVAVSDRIMTLFRVTHVDGLIPIYDTLEEAARHMSKAASA